MRRLIAILALYLGAISTLSAQDVVTDLSEREIDIRYSFDGANLLLFGAVERSGLEPSSPFDVIVVVRGPSEDIIVRQKQRMVGIWVNQDVHTFAAAPGYYNIATSRELADIADINYLNTHGIGYQSLGLATEDHDEHADEFRSALVRGKERVGLYSDQSGGVSFVGGGLFRADIQLPANVPVGDFLIETFVFQDGEIVGIRQMTLNVDKAGFERAVYDYAHGYPFLYGLTAVIIALFAGWFAGFFSRKQV